MFVVLDNDMYADERVHTKLKGKGWASCEFDTIEKAIEYANKWLGKYGPLPNHWPLNRKWSYSGAGDTIEIKEIK